MKSILLLLLFVLVTSFFQKYKRCNEIILKQEVKIPTEKPAISDSMFTDVLEIDNDYLPLKPLLEQELYAVKTPVVYMDRSNPDNFFHDLKPSITRAIILKQNWEYYEDVARGAPPGGCAEPSRSIIVYEFRRQNGHISKDSLIRFGDLPIINFKAR